MKQIKKIIWLFLLVFMLSFSVFAQDSVTDEEIDTSLAGAVPGDGLRFMFSDTIPEGLTLMFIFNEEEKAMKRLEIAQERAIELRKCAEENNTECVAQAQALMEKQTESARNLAEGLSDVKKAAVLEKLQKHEAVLNRVQEKLKAKGVDAPGLANAISNAQRNRERFRERIGLSEDDLDLVISAVKKGADLDTIKIKYENNNSKVNAGSNENHNSNEESDRAFIRRPSGSLIVNKK